jgi:hypothetical protein
MKKRIAAGAAGGLLAGVIFALMAQLIMVSTPGDRTSMLVTAATAIHSHGRLAGWVASLVYSVVIGGFFGRLLHSQARPLNEQTLMVMGGMYGVGWWILSGVVVVPALLGRVPLSSDAVAVMRPLALASLADHVVYGVILGFAFARIAKYVDRLGGGTRGAIRPTQRAA